MGGVLDAAETINSWGNVLTVPLSIFPLLLNLKYYYQLKIRDYFFVSLYFLYWSLFNGFWLIFSGFNLDPIIQFDGLDTKFPLWFNNFYYQYFWIIVNTIDALPLVIVAVRGKYGNEVRKIPKWLLTLILIPIILALFGCYDQGATMIRSDNPWSSSILWGLLFGRLIYHSVIIYCFLTMDFRNTKRTFRSRLLWIFGSLGWIISMLYICINTFIFNYQFETDPIIDATFFFFIIIGSIFILLNHVYYPEAVIITHEQVHQAAKLYKKIELSGNKITDLGIKRVKSYLDTIPSEFFNS